MTLRADSEIFMAYGVMLMML